MAAFNAFSVSGIRVRIDQSWFIAFLLFSWTLSVGYFPFQVPDYPTYTYWLAGSISSLAFFGCVLLHELSHCVVARRAGIPVRQITLFIFGGVSEMAEMQSRGPAVEFMTTIAGPLASAAIGVLFMVLTVALRGIASRIVVEMFHYIYYVNFLLAIFNLIPGFPLDGGRVLRSYIWYRTGDLRKATRSAATVGRIFAMTLMAIGLAAAITGHLIPGVWLVLIGMFLKNSAEKEQKSFELRFGLQDMTVGDVMTPPIAVNTSITISQFINDYVFHYHYRVFPVVESNRFIGMMDVRSIKGVPPAQWPRTKIAAYLSDPSTYCKLAPNMNATDALRMLLNTNCSKAPVVSDNVLLGILTRSDLVKLVSLRRDIAA